ncbi:MAG: NAD(P)-dependent oxidoreductase, partial [Candidatus Paceibacterota bacterium]
VMEKLPQLKLIATRSTGFDHIDVSAATEKGVTVVNVPGYGSHTVAEFAFALLLNLSRKVYQANEKIRETADFSFLGLRGFDLHGKTLGVIGTGKIGKNVINIALGFGMKVIAFDLYPDQNLAKDKGFEYKTLEEVLSHADVITLHAPYTKENHHLLNKEMFSVIKKGAYLINTARGELVDTDALIVALSDGTLAGAGLDVLEGERELKEELEILSDPNKRDHIKDYKTLFEGKVLMDLPNVIVTPHLAFYSKEAEEEIIKTTIDNINNFLKGTPTNSVEPKK